ncbi:MAG: hypothetical protein M0P74_02655 [Syntrophales bacterium]|nr:hypothetical protein [Syntrophales bacterium]
MADKKVSMDIPGQSILYFGLCLLGISIFIFVGILPTFKEGKYLDKQTMAVKQMLQEQKILLPYLLKMKERSGQKDQKKLVLQQKGKLASEEIKIIPVTLAEKAKMSGMTIVSVTPTLTRLSGKDSLLPVDIVLRGKFSDFRLFLINLGELYCLDRIDEMSIQQKPDGKEYRLTLLIAVG